MVEDNSAHLNRGSQGITLEDADINGKGQRYTQCAHGPSVCGQTLRAARELSLFERKTRKSFQAKVASSKQRSVREFECYAFEDARTWSGAVMPAGGTGYPPLLFSPDKSCIKGSILTIQWKLEMLRKPYHMHNK